ncbi:MAG: hypothetical protein ACE5FC_03645 [Myxococcota bacterium]
MAGGETRKAKGVLVAQHVRVLRKARDENLLEGLTPAQREIVASYVLPSSWYPYEVYARTLDIIFNRISGGEPDAARGMGHFMAYEMLQGPYSMYLKRGDPLVTLSRFKTIWKNYFNFGEVSFNKCANTEDGKTPNCVEMAIRGFPDFPYPLSLIVEGFLEKTVELAGGVDPKIELDRGTGPDQPNYTCHIAWQKVIPT